MIPAHFSERIGEFVIDGPNFANFKCQVGLQCDIRITEADTSNALRDFNRISIAVGNGCDGRPRAVLPGMLTRMVKSEKANKREGIIAGEMYLLGVPVDGSVPGRSPLLSTSSPVVGLGVALAWCERGVGRASHVALRRIGIVTSKRVA